MFALSSVFGLASAVKLVHDTFAGSPTVMAEVEADARMSQLPREERKTNERPGDTVVFNRGYVRRVYEYHFGSESRDKRIYPHAHDYYVRFPHGTLQNMIDVSVLNAVVPRSEYGINESNNLLVIEEAFPNKVVTIQVPEGDYLTTTLCQTLHRLLRSNSDLRNTYKVLYSGSTKRLAIVATVETEHDIPTVFRFHTKKRRTITNVLGFDEEASEYNTRQVGPGRMNIVGPTFVDVRIPEFSRDEVMARVSLDSQINKYNGHALHDKWKHPMGRLEGLTIQFVTFDARTRTAVPYNFRGFDNSVTLQVTTLIPAPMEMTLTN